MNDTDICQRFLIEDSTVRGEIVILDDAIKAVLAKHDYPQEIQGLLGEMLAAVVLLAATVKIDGALIMQARGGDPVDLVMVECDAERNVRALARWHGDTGGKGFRELLNGASLVITLDPKRGERYQGIVPLEGDNIAQALEFYFAQSEQLPTRIWLRNGVGRAAGLLLQQLPFNSDVQISPEQNAEDWNRLTMLSNTLTAEEHLHLDPEIILQRLFAEENVRLFPKQVVTFKCSCSRERFGAALVNLGREELTGIIEEQGCITTHCEFCNERYVFDNVDVAQLLTPGASNAPAARQ